MSYYASLLEDLDHLEDVYDIKWQYSWTEIATPCLKDKMNALKHLVLYILPYWESRSQAFHIRANKIYKKRSDELTGLEEFVDNELRELRFGAFMQSAARFYEGEIEVGEYSRFRFIERLALNLRYYSRSPMDDLSDPIKKFLKDIGTRMEAYIGFVKLVEEWDFENLVDESTRDNQLLSISKQIEVIPRKAASMYRISTELGGQRMLDEDSLHFVVEIESALRQAESIYIDVMRRHFNVSLCFITSLTFWRLMSELETMLRLYRSTLLKELQFVKSVVKYTAPLDQDWMCGLVFPHVNVLLEESLHATDEVSRMSRYYFSTARKNLRKNCSDTAFACIHEFIQYYSVHKEDGEALNSPPAKKNLELLQTLLQHEDNWVRLNPQVETIFQQIKELVSEAWCDLQSLRLRKLMFKNSAAPTLGTNSVLLNLEKSLSSLQLPKKILLEFLNLTISDLRSNEVKSDAETLIRETTILKNMVTCLITQPWAKDESLLQTIIVEATTVASIYTRLFNGLEAESKSREAIEGFEGSVGQSYLQFTKLSPLGSEFMFSSSEFVFQEMFQILVEFKEGGAAATTGTEHQIELLHEIFLLCSSFLENNSFKYNEPREVMQLRTQITKTCRKVEYVIDAFEMVPHWFFKMWLTDVTKEFKLIKEDIINLSSVQLSSRAGETSHAMPHNQAEENEAKISSGEVEQAQGKMLCFEEQRKHLRKILLEGRQGRDIISIIGMPGLGKTTLAKNLYDECMNSFDAHAWCYVSKQVDKKELLRHIITEIGEEPTSKEHDLSLQLKQILSKKSKYLIVLDDIWDMKAWNELKHCLPKCGTSRILITSRDRKVALAHNADDSRCLELDLLNPDNSWRLLEKKVFGDQSCPLSLLKVGKKIANRCGGLPLSIVVIGGTLRKMEKTKQQWTKIVKSMESHLLVEGDEVYSKIELSYNHLPIHLKQCFLYSGAVSQGKEIPRWKLVQLWCAERFATFSKQESPECVAEKYLSDLVDRSLLIVVKTGFNNRIQTCRIHDYLRDFAIQKATSDRFLVTTDRFDCSTFLERRLFYRGQDVLEFLDNKSPTRSLFIQLKKFGEMDFNLLKWQWQSLVVLDMGRRGLRLGGYLYFLPQKWLRYLSLCLSSYNNSEGIQSAISECLNLETLVATGYYVLLSLPGTVTNMKKLRYIRVSGRVVIYGMVGRNSFTSLESFSTLSLFGSTAHQVVARMPNLVKFKCRFEDDDVDFRSLDCLNKLECLNVFYDPVGKYKHMLSFPPNLKKLTISKFRFSWSQVDTIASLLPHLEVLKLLKKAIEGSTWRTFGVFPNLKYLRLEELDVEQWAASDDNFPALQRLVVINCEKLISIPKSFGEIDYLKGIEIQWCSPSVVKSAFKIKKKQIYGGNMQFEVNTYPAVAMHNDSGDDDDTDDDDDENDDDAADDPDDGY